MKRLDRMEENDGRREKEREMKESDETVGGKML